MEQIIDQPTKLLEIVMNIEGKVAILDKQFEQLNKAATQDSPTTSQINTTK
jgi:hypothetical protein